jgi:hypothetical protein
MRRAAPGSLKRKLPQPSSSLEPAIKKSCVVEASADAEADTDDGGDCDVDEGVVGSSPQLEEEEKLPRTAFTGRQLESLWHQFRANHYVGEKRRQVSHYRIPNFSIFVFPLLSSITLY